ncbi:hypothetical protein F4814DRAFT_61218 [Daldinia grandis]|nr:hypothetical protein F4814DRAFT_61218 [Daldinia grandis]
MRSGKDIISYLKYPAVIPLWSIMHITFLVPLTTAASNGYIGLSRALCPRLGKYQVVSCRCFLHMREMNDSAQRAAGKIMSRVSSISTNNIPRCMPFCGHHVRGLSFAESPTPGGGSSKSLTLKITLGPAVKLAATLHDVGTGEIVCYEPRGMLNVGSLGRR